MLHFQLFFPSLSFGIVATLGCSIQWIGLWENLQETIDFPLNQSIEACCSSAIVREHEGTKQPCLCQGHLGYQGHCQTWYVSSAKQVDGQAMLYQLVTIGTYETL